MFDGWSWEEWLLAVVVVGWSLRLAYKFGLETGRDDIAEMIRSDPERAIRQIEAERKVEGGFRRWARGRRD